MRTLVLSFVALAVFSGATSSGAPDAATLGLPVYPGARFDDGLSKMYLKLGVRAGMPAPKAFAAFATSHGIERVAEFYRTNLRPPDPALASTWFAVDEEDLQFLVGSQLDALEGPARRKAEAVVNAGKGKKVKFSTGAGIWGSVNGAVGIQRPYLNANGDLMDQTIITVNVLK